MIFSYLKGHLKSVHPLLSSLTTIQRLTKMTPTTSSTSKLTELRKLMTENGLSAYYIPSEDAHQSEYISERDGRRAFISNFTGSAGFAIVTMEKAALWTDGRYFLQANKQLSSDWILMKAGLPETPSKEKWLGTELKSGQRVGVDPALISFEAAKKLKSTLSNNGDIDLVPIETNLIDSVWAADQPAFEPKLIEHLPIEFSGQSSSDKVSDLRSYLKTHNYSSIVLSGLDEIAWLFNLRGNDINFNPVFFSYALITREQSIIFLTEDQLSQDAKMALESDKVIIEDYRNTFKRIKEICSNSKDILITSTCNWKLVEFVGVERIRTLSNEIEPVVSAKSVKNETEINGFRQCHIRDGAALCKYFAWLESQFQADPAFICDEVDGAERLESFRKEGKHFKGLSFDTISGSGPNGAIIHYKPEKPGAALIKTDQMYLCDSGAQYLDGTTDVTRTVHFGTPSPYEKECFTRVLKGNLALERAVFPAGTSGLQLDALARLPLWESGLDFRHGTGHGVGHFLNVHEGPQSISFRVSSFDAKFRPGMTITNEPGYYEDGKFGIRIENVLIVKKVETASNFGNVGYYGFENLTMCPIQARLLDLNIMTREEIDQLNKYHRKVWMNLSPMLKGEDRKWLEDQCQPIKFE